MTAAPRFGQKKLNILLVDDNIFIRNCISQCLQHLSFRGMRGCSSGIDANLEICRAHLDTLRAVIRERIEGDGGASGRQLMMPLNQAIHKFLAENLHRMAVSAEFTGNFSLK